MKTTANLAALGAFALISSASLGACSKPAETGTNTTSEAETSAAPAAPDTAAQATALKTLPAAYQTADLENGARQFNKCRSCHTLEKGGMTLVGPNLYTVFDRKAGTLAGYSYSDAMKAHGVTWDFDTLDTYLTAPQDVVKGTKMGFVGIKADKDRHDLIAYIRVNTLSK